MPPRVGVAAGSAAVVAQPGPFCRLFAYFSNAGRFGSPPAST